MSFRAPPRSKIDLVNSSKKKGFPAALPENRLRHRRRKPSLYVATFDNLRRVSRRKRLQPDLAGVGMMEPGGTILLTIGDDQQHRQFCDRFHKICKKVIRQLVDPMHVLDRQDEGLFARPSEHDFPDSAEYSLRENAQAEGRKDRRSRGRC